MLIISAATAGLILGHIMLYAAETAPTERSQENARIATAANASAANASAASVTSASVTAAATDSATSGSAKDADNPGWDNGTSPGPGIRRDGFRKGHPERDANRNPEGRMGRDRDRNMDQDRGRDGKPGSDFRPPLSPLPEPGFSGPNPPEGSDRPDAPPFANGPMHRDKFGRMGMPPRGPFPDWQELEKCDPEMFNLLKEDAQGEMKTRNLTMQYRQARGESKENIGQQLEEAVKAHFAVRQKRRALELSRLEDELKRMKELFEKRNLSQDKIIEQRIKALKGDDENLF